MVCDGSGGGGGSLAVCRVVDPDRFYPDQNLASEINRIRPSKNPEPDPT